MFEFKSFENAGRQAAYLMSLKAAKYGPDGYANFLPPESQYDLRKARQAIYGSPEPKAKSLPASPVTISADQRAQWLYPTHAYLRKMLEGLPAATRKVLFFVPYHVYSQPLPGTKAFIELQDCKARISAIVAPVENATLLDFMIGSPLTARDEKLLGLLALLRDGSREIRSLDCAGCRKSAGAGWRIPDSRPDLTRSPLRPCEAAF